MSKPPTPLPYEWEASFVFRGSELRAPWDYNGFHFENDTSLGDINRIKGVYTFNTTTTGSIVEKTALRAIDNLFNALTITTYDMNAPDLAIVEDFNLRCTNIAALIEAGQPTPTSFHINYNVNRIFRPDYLTKIFQQYESLSANRVFPVIDRITHLYRFARGNSDYFVKFDFMWKAFNAFYDFLYNERTGVDPELARISQMNRVKQFVDELISSTDATSLIANLRRPISEINRSLLGFFNNNSTIDVLVSRNLTTTHRTTTRNHSLELSGKAARTNDIETLKSILNCLYFVRCQITHGDLFSQDDQNFAYLCSIVLGEILAIGLNNYLRPIVAP